MFRIKIAVGLVLLVPKWIKFITRKKSNQQNKAATVKYLHSAHLSEGLARTGPLVQELAGQVFPGLQLQQLWPSKNYPWMPVGK